MATKAKARPSEDTFGPPTKADDKRARSRARSEERMLADIYEQGRSDARRELRDKSKGGRRGGKRTARRRRRRPNRSLVRGAKAVAGPAAADIGSGMAIVGATFGLLLLYLVLTNAKTTSGLLDAIRRGLEWLASPATSIPHHR